LISRSSRDFRKAGSALADSTVMRRSNPVPSRQSQSKLYMVYSIESFFYLPNLLPELKRARYWHFRNQAV
jgi:hypothetical protein